jgi:hypothetical protein
MFNGNVVKWIVSSQIIFPEIYTVCRSDGDCRSKLRGDAALIAVSETVFGAKRTSDLEYFKECVWLQWP